LFFSGAAVAQSSKPTGEHLHGLCARNLLARRAAEKQKENISDSGLSINPLSVGSSLRMKMAL